MSGPSSIEAVFDAFQLMCAMSEAESSRARVARRKALEGKCAMKRLLTVREVADLLRISNMTVYRLVKNGQLPAARVGKNYRIREEDVSPYLDRGVNLRSVEPPG